MSSFLWPLDAIFYLFVVKTLVEAPSPLQGIDWSQALYIPFGSMATLCEEH
jgi:hypothetical protein